MTLDYFVIIGSMRTGSNLLESHMTALPGVVTFGEAFNPAFTGGPKHGDLMGWTVADRDADPIGFLAALRAGSPGSMIGFRLFDGHSPKVLEHAVSDPRCKVIILRRDPAESFVSLGIAQETGQWLLKNLRRRMRAKIRFDRVAYDHYASRLEAHYRAVDAGLARAGKTAIEITFEQLTELTEINRVAASLGIHDRLESLDPEIMRQNPEPIEDKVVNPDEMLAHLGRRRSNRSGLDIKPGKWVLSRHANVAWYWLPGQEAGVGLGVLNMIDHHCDGTARLPMHRLTRDPAANFDETAQVAEVDGRISFILAEAPLLRFHSLFLAQTFRGRRALHFVLRALDDAFGPTGPLKDWVPQLETEEGLNRHRARFIGFLDLISEARAGRGIHPMHDGWHRQADYTTAAHQGDHLVTVVRRSDLAEDLAEIVSYLGMQPLHGGEITRLNQIGQHGLSLPDRIATPEILERISALDASVD